MKPRPFGRQRYLDSLARNATWDGANRPGKVIWPGARVGRRLAVRVAQMGIRHPCFRLGALRRMRARVVSERTPRAGRLRLLLELRGARLVPLIDVWVCGGWEGLLRQVRGEWLARVWVLQGPVLDGMLDKGHMFFWSQKNLNGLPANKSSQSQGRYRGRFVVFPVDGL